MKIGFLKNWWENVSNFIKQCLMEDEVNIIFITCSLKGRKAIQPLKKKPLLALTKILTNLIWRRDAKLPFHPTSTMAIFLSSSKSHNCMYPHFYRSTDSKQFLISRIRTTQAARPGFTFALQSPKALRLDFPFKMSPFTKQCMSNIIGQDPSSKMSEVFGSL